MSSSLTSSEEATKAVGGSDKGGKNTRTRLASGSIKAKRYDDGEVYSDTSDREYTPGQPTLPTYSNRPAPAALPDRQKKEKATRKAPLPEAARGPVRVTAKAATVSTGTTAVSTLTAPGVPFGQDKNSPSDSPSASSSPSPSASGYHDDDSRLADLATKNMELTAVVGALKGQLAFERLERRTDRDKFTYAMQRCAQYEKEIGELKTEILTKDTIIDVLQREREGSTR